VVEGSALISLYLQHEDKTAALEAVASHASEMKKAMTPPQ